MRLVDDNQVPTGGDEIAEALAVVLFDLFLAPSATPLHRLYGVHRANDLVESAPEILLAREATVGAELARDEEPELLVEVRPHLGHPLSDETLRSNDERSPDEPAELQLAHDEAGFDR